MPKHFFFDLDNTLTRSKSHIAPEHVPILRELAERADVIVVSGHGEKDITEHLEDQMKGRYHILGQNGNKATTRDGRMLWERTLTDEQKAAAHEFIAKARTHLPLPVKDESDLVDDRGCQIAYSLIGHHEEKAKKEAFDPDHAIRQKLLHDLASDVRTLNERGIEVVSGGTTVLDMFEMGKNKGYNVREFIAAMHWNPDECIYIGDALFPGGNDETVVGIIATHAVKDYRETYEYVTQLMRTSATMV